MAGSGPDKKTPFYITTAISYVNGEPHLGHAYEAIATDVVARFKRLDGYDVHFLTGTDEHGQKVEKSASAAGQEPRAFCDDISQKFRDMTELLKISNDDFIRTTEKRHIASSQAIWTALADAGDIYLDNYAGWYSVRDESFFGEDELTKTEDGGFLSPYGAPVEWVEEPSYFFRLSAYGDKLLKHYEDNPDFIRPEYRRNEVVSFVKQGLNDLSISRTSFDWGIAVPGDPKHIMYVWLDALTNYITAVGYPNLDDPAFKTYWPADLHVIGKDIVRHHAIYWPAFLMSAGVPLPKRVFGHGFLNVEGQKMSKSVGNVLSPEALVTEFGLDQMRYFVLREVPFGNDGSISRESMIRRSNSDLSNDLGNLAQRVLSMINRNCDGQVQAPGNFSREDNDLLDKAHGLLEDARGHFEVPAFHDALESIWRVVRAANVYVDRQEPWKLRKGDPERMGTVLYQLAEVIRHLAILIQPFMPESAGRLLDQLAVPQDKRDFSFLGPDHALTPGSVLPKPEGVFPRFVEEAEAGPS